MFLKSKFSIGLLCFILVHKCTSKTAPIIEDANYWNFVGAEELSKILSIKNIENRAKNVVIFMGDGMGMSSVTAGRIFKGQTTGKFFGEEYKLSFEKFPNTAFTKTYNVDYQVTDSAAAAVAIFSGVKVKNNMLGLDAKAEYKKCDKRLNKIARITTIADWAQNSNVDTGFVTNTRVSHASPAALYAHVNDRSWECDTKVPEDQRDCIKDIPRQLVEDAPGRNFKVIMGGGGRCFCINEYSKCERADNKNLTDIWMQTHPKGKVLTNRAQLLSKEKDAASHLLGIFSYNHLAYSAKKTPMQPSLAEMTEEAIKFLKKSSNGFFLFVENGLIDSAHHENKARLAVNEMVDFDNAIEKALSLLDLKESLIIVTADHSHSLNINGYPKRGSNIVSYTNRPRDIVNKNPYDILSYTMGPGFIYHRINDSENNGGTFIHVENDPNRNSLDYVNFAGEPLRAGPHTGEDVGIYAIGTFSHLFRSTVEQNYIAHAIAYAASYKK